MPDESNKQQILINIGSLLGNVERQTINHNYSAANEAATKSNRNQHFSLTPEQLAAFSRAEDAGYMPQLGEDKYKWHKQKVSLAYFIGRLFCGDYVSLAAGKQIWKQEGVFPEVAMTEMFGEKNLANYRTNRKDDSLPKDFRLIDSIVEGESSSTFFCPHPQRLKLLSSLNFHFVFG